MVPEKLDNLIDTFQSVDSSMRLELLLDYARRLPRLPGRLDSEQVKESNRVPECMTPVFLRLERDEAGMHLYADVGEEAPTVRGIVSILVSVCEGGSAEQIASLPQDLLNRLGLSELLRMNRVVGIAAIISRIRSLAGRYASHDRVTAGSQWGSACPAGDR